MTKLGWKLNSVLACLAVFCCSMALFEAQPATAWPGKKKAAADPVKPAPEAVVNPNVKPVANSVANSAASPDPGKLMVRDKGTMPNLTQTDRSANLTYILPPDWLATQNPFYGHDLLMKKSMPKASLVIADRDARGGLGKVSKVLEAELAKQCQDFKMVSNEITLLTSGVSCARLISTGKVEDVEICQVNYLMPYIHGRLLLVTGTVTRGDDPGIATCDQFASSIKVKKAKGLL